MSTVRGRGNVNTGSEGGNKVSLGKYAPCLLIRNVSGKEMHLLLSLFSLAAGQCPANLISSSNPNTLIERSPGVYTHSALLPSPPSVWTSLPGANWIWESNADSVGVFAFVTTFAMAEWACNSISHLFLSISADNLFSVVFNGVVVVPQWTGDFIHVFQYDLKPWILGSSAALGTQVNTLQMPVWNLGGPGGLIYKLEIVY